jgi:hypothetical protein
MAAYVCFYCDYETTSEADLTDHIGSCAKALCLDCGKAISPLGGAQSTVVRVSRRGSLCTLGATMHPTCGQGSVLYKLVNDPRLK